MSAHLGKFLQDEFGNVIPGASVEVRNVGATTKIAATVKDRLGNALTNPFTADADGKCEFYLDTPQQVDLFVTKAGFDNRTFTVDVIALTASTLTVTVAGVSMTQRAGLDFEGDTPVGTDDSINNKTIVTINHKPDAVHTALQPPTAHHHTVADATGTVAHSDTTGKTANDHHNQSHPDTDHSGANKVEVDLNDVLVGTRAKVDFKDSTYLKHTIADNAGAARVEVTPALVSAPGTSTPVASAPGDTGLSGTGTEFALVTHRHAREGWAAAETSTVTATGSSDGTSIREARADHIHGHSVGPFLPDAHHTEIHKPAKHTFVGCRATKSVDQTGIANNTLTAITWDQEDFDSDGCHDTVTNNSRFTVPTGMAGKWRFQAVTKPENNSTGSINMIVRKNGTTQLVGYHAQAENPSETAALEFTVVLAAADYLEVMYYQNSGGPRQVTATFAFDGTNALTSSWVEFEYKGA